MADISQTTKQQQKKQTKKTWISIEILHQILFLWVEWKIVQHWFRQWPADQGDKPLSEPMVVSLLTHMASLGLNMLIPISNKGRP